MLDSIKWSCSIWLQNVGCHVTVYINWFELICVHFVGTVTKHIRLTHGLWTTHKASPLFILTQANITGLVHSCQNLTFQTNTDNGSSLHDPFTPTQNITKARWSYWSLVSGNEVMFMIWYAMIRYMIWYDMWYMIWYMMWYDIWYDIYDLIWYDTIWYMMWYDIYDMIRYDSILYDRYMIWYETMIWYMIRYDIWYDNMIYDTIRYIWYDMIWYDIWYDIFNCNWVATRWQECSTHLHTNNT